MILEVEISKQNIKQIINAIKLLKGVKSVSELSLKGEQVIKTKIKKRKNEPIKEGIKPKKWLLEARDMEKNPHKYKSYSDMDELFRDLLK
ncbi:hypothetical protein [Campylobacter troglodytis]|uniref:hypothetical protein n=1 Tax=Campylobacter troglodytis TaxID=654363 RepID=UPI00115A15A5|nr:hypothetical protein [Campylobacter troglodytis]TQR61567.1 hypothetical protein DMC01_00940 [Campylobacter troglodytis]